MRTSAFLPIIVIVTLLAFIADSCLQSPDNQEVKLTALNSMERIQQDEPLSGQDHVSIMAAKNEFESFQVVVGAILKNIRVTGAEISDLNGKSGTIGKENFVLFREEYTRVRRSSKRSQLPPGLYPDPLVPFINPVTNKPIEPFNQYRKRWGEPFISSGFEMYALPFDVWKGQNQPIWVDLYIPENTVAGEYKGTFTITLDNMPDQYGPQPEPVLNKVISIPVTVTVWDFTIPDGPSHKNHFGDVDRVLPRLFGVEPRSPESLEIELRYCQMMADHRINPPIPKTFLPEVKHDGSLQIIPEHHLMLKRFMEDLNVTDFQIPRAPFNDITTTNRVKAIRYYKEFYQYLKDNGWEKRAYLYMLDEPNLKENYEEVLALGKLAHEAVPEMRCLVVEQPYKQDPTWPDIDPAVDIWCPLWSFIDRESIDSKLEHGDEVWSYTALSQRSPGYHPQHNEVKDNDPPYWHIDDPLTSYRTPTWLNWQYKINGLLYWSSVQISRSITGVMDPWLLPAFSESDSQYNGGGYLIYPGVPCGIDGPISCMRLKNIRDSMEDWEYFAILEKLAGRKAVTKIISGVAPNWWATSGDPQVILANREKLAQEIVKLKK